MKTSKTSSISLKKDIKKIPKHHAHRLLRESEDRYRKLMDSANDAIFVAEATTGILVDANRKASKMIGYKKREIIGKHQSFLHPSKEEEDYKKIFKEAVKKEKDITPPLFAKHKSGHLIPIEISSSVFEFGGKKMVQGIFRDITERQKIEEHKNAFVSMVIHELKTPITTLKLLTQAILKKFPDDESHKMPIKMMNLINKEHERLARLINDLYDISRIETGKLALTLNKIKLSELLDEVVGKIKLIHPEYKIIIRNSDEVFINCDSQRLEQVVINILTNAIKFSPKNKNITISILKKDGSAIVKIRDHGVGIPKRELPFIFDRFYQTKQSKSKGLGLGLYITKEIILHHKGKIWVESKPKKGTTFYFSLPLAS